MRVVNLKVEIAIFPARRNGKFPVFARSTEGNKILNYENSSMSSIWGKNEPFTNTWEYLPEEIEKVIGAIKTDLNYLASIGISSVLEVGGPGAIGTPWQGIYVFGKPDPKTIDERLITFSVGDYEVHATRMEFVGKKPENTEAVLKEILHQASNFVISTIEIQKRKNALRRLRNELPTNIDADLFKKFTEMTTPQTLIARGQKILEGVLTPFERLISNTQTLYVSINQRKFVVFDPTTKLYESLIALIDEGYDIHPTPVQIWTELDRANGYKETYKMSKKSMITVKGLITTANADGHLYLLSMFTRNGNKTYRITDDLYNMVSRFAGVTKSEFGEIIQSMRGYPVGEAPQESRDQITQILERIKSCEEYQQLIKDYSFLPEEYLAPFNLYMIDKYDTLLLLAQKQNRVPMGRAVANDIKKMFTL